MASKKQSEDKLKGTLYMVFGLGIIIIAVWAYAFSLFTDRF